MNKAITPATKKTGNNKVVPKDRKKKLAEQRKKKDAINRMLNIRRSRRF